MSISIGSDGWYYAKPLDKASESCLDSDAKLKSILDELKEILKGEAGTVLLQKFEAWKKTNKDIEGALSYASSEVQRAVCAFEVADRSLAKMNEGSSKGGHSGSGSRC